MKKLYASFILILFSTGIFASHDPKDALLMQSGTVYPVANISEFISEQISLEEIVDGYFYRIIQFKSIPDDNMKTEIKASGILMATAPGRDSSAPCGSRL